MDNTVNWASPSETFTVGGAQFTVGGVHKRGLGTPEMVPGTIFIGGIHIF